MNDSDPRAEQIFALAVGITNPAACRACLKQACAGDAQLLAEVESLLAAHEQADAFMRTEAAGAWLGVPPSGGPELAKAGTPSVSSEKSGDRIGRYKLLEKIGEAGFGDVWMAEQERRSAGRQITKPSLKRTAKTRTSFKVGTRGNRGLDRAAPHFCLLRSILLLRVSGEHIA